jgi:hypothetical protein
MLPPPHPQSPPRRAPAPPRRASPLSWDAWRRALLRPPQALSPLPPPWLWARGAQAPTSRGELVPIALLLLVRQRVLRSRWGRESLLLAQLELLTPLFPALPSPDPILLLARRPLLFPLLRRARALVLGAWAGRTMRRSRLPAAGNERKVRPRGHATSKWRERRQKVHSPVGRGRA